MKTDNSLKYEIASRLKEIRQKEKLTQRNLAKILKCTPQAISAYETATNFPDIFTLIKYSTLFKISTDYLLGITDSKIPNIDKVFKEIGLTEKSTINLKKISTSKKNKEYLNQILENKNLPIIFKLIVNNN